MSYVTTIIKDKLSYATNNPETNIVDKLREYLRQK